MLTFEWSTMDIADKQVLTTTPRHTLGDWIVSVKPGGGVGMMDVLQGDGPTPPLAIRKMLMVQGVQGVVTLQGCFVVIVKDQRRWAGIKPSIESILAVELKGHLDAVGISTDAGV